MSTGKGIAIPAPKKPVQAAGTTVFTREPDGIHRYTGTAGGIELFKREIRSQAGGGGDPEPEPATSAARKPLSVATRLKMAAAQKKRQAELRRTQEGAGASGTANPATPAGKRKPKTMTAGSSA